MNGEPRENALTTADIATSANRPAASVQTDRPVLEAINTDGVTQTAIKEDVKLAPLFTQHVATDFRSRLDVAAITFSAKRYPAGHPLAYSSSGSSRPKRNAPWRSAARAY